MDTAAAIDFLKAKVALIFAHSWTKKKAEAYEKERLQFLKESTAHMVGHPVVIQLATELKAHFVDQLVLELADKKHSLENQNWIPEAASRQSETDWENKLGELESTPPKMAQLFALDNLLEAAIKRQVPADCRFTLTAFLTENYGIKRLNSRSIKSATPKALTDDWVALLPRADPPPLAHIERTPEQLALMPPVMKDQKVWTITATTIGELAQLYADHSGHEVRLEKALLGRPNQYVGRQINGKAELADMLSQHLSINEIELMHRLGGIIELKDNWAKEAERRKSPNPSP